MADRGFTIAEDLLLHKADLFITPGKRGQEQFTKADVQKTKTGNLRIFVEQARNIFVEQAVIPSMVWVQTFSASSAITQFKISIVCSRVCSQV